MKSRNQFEFFSRVNKAVAMYAFSNGIEISEVKVSYQSVTLTGYKLSEQCNVSFEFTSLEHLEKAAYGF
ncbi:hypothetical protein CPT_Solomon_067 [Klebsiella phage Solomon]|uniref:Uncharacterized protein n=1 Tax=Klebsiella phage Solomon TaxID=2767583 RepID=A0A873WN82_9CAUD|nr:hypothetical protein CPT_Solomon_067 [Klebsiella phage Solomon]